MNPTVDIFVKSYSKDYRWLYFSLRSITKNVTGYNNIILLIPESDKELFDTRGMPERMLIYYIKEYGDGNLFQQWCKVNAPAYSYADYIMFSDSDCVFDHAIDLQEFVADGKPEILYTSWDKVGDAKCWKAPTEHFLKEPVPFEFMRRNCLIYHRSTLLAILEYAPGLEETIMHSEHFSEFNIIGAFAYKYERDKYNFVNTDDWSYVPAKAEQFWSHATKGEGVSELHLRQYIRILEILLKANDIPVP